MDLKPLIPGYHLPEYYLKVNVLKVLHLLMSYFMSLVSG